MTLSQVPPVTTARRVSLNAVSNVVVVVVDMVTAFLLLSFILSRMSLSEYGIWELTGSIFAYAPLLQVGINSAVNFHVPRLMITADQESINRVVSTGAVFYIFGAGVVVIATALLVIFFPVWFNIEPHHAGISRILVVMVGAYFTCALPLAISQGVLSGLQLYVQMNAVRVVTHLARAGLIVLLLSLGCGLLGLGIAHVTTRLIEAGAMPVLLRRALPQLKLRLAYASFSTFKMMLGYSVNTFLWGAGISIINRVGLIVIGILLTTRDATLFAVPLMLVWAFSAIAESLSAVSKPAASALYAENRLDRVRELSLRGSRLTVMVLWPVGVLMVAFGGPFLDIWVGLDFRPVVGILMLLVVAQFLFDGQRVASLVLIGMGRHRLFGVFTLGAAIVDVVVSVVLVTRYDLGLWGVAIGQVVALVAVSVGFVPVYVSRVLEMPITRHLFASLGRPVLASLPFLVLVAAVRYNYYPGSLMTLCAACAACCPVLLVCYWFWGATRQDRTAVLGLVRRRRRAGT